MNKKQRRRAKRQKEKERRSHENGTANKSAETKPTPSGRPHLLTIIFSVIALFLTCIALYWNITQPDIRYVSTLGPETLTVVESKVDGAGNFVHSLRLRPTFTNHSLKPGFIDKAELVPQSIATLPDVKVTSINKTFIFWHQQKQIEITFLMTVPTDPLNHLNTIRELTVDQVLAVFDNTGRKVDHLEDGMFGRIRFNLKDIVNTQLGGIRTLPGH
jgi:hypothetical protein